MCSNVKKTPQKNEENTVKVDKNNTEKAKSEVGMIPIPLEEEFKDMEEWEGKFLHLHLFLNFLIKNRRKILRCWSKILERL